MTWYQLLFYIATAPVAILGAIAIVYVVFLSWVLLFAALGSTRAQEYWRNL